MATEAAAAKDAEFILVSLLPDVCLTPNRKGKAVPYPITHDMGESKQCSPNVFFRGKPAYLHEESYVDNVKGDEPGGGKGVVSRTHVKISRSEQYSHNVFGNGRHLVRTGDKAWMTRPEPGDAGGSAAASGKKARWECRQGQIAAARDTLSELPDGADKDRLQAAADRFERNNVAVEHAKLSDVIYDPNKRAEGWNDISDQAEKLEQYGLKPGDLEIEGSNFRARVYEPDPAVFGNDMKPTVVFKGTQNGEDWKNNLAQGIDRHSDYYKQAVTIGKNIKESGAVVDITGHSLGGGLTGAASQASGMPATTFNAAGLHGNTVERYGGTVHQTDIQAYRIEGEILTGVQEPGWGGTAAAAGAGFALGGIKGAAIGMLARWGLSALMPDAVGTPHVLEGTGLNPIDRHGMEQVIAGIEAQKSEDQQTIASATGKTCK